MRTSYSAIETYLQCPQKFKFQNIDRIRAPKGREALFGTLIHDALRYMFKSDPLFPTLDEVMAYYRAHWPERQVFEAQVKADPRKRAWSEQEEKIYFEEGLRMLKKFYEKNAPWNFSVLELESHFEITLTDEKTGETHVLAGIMDRVDKLPDEKYEIIDYKTSKRMPSQDAMHENLQLSLYSLGLQKRWPHIKPEDIKLSLYFLKHGEKLSTVPSVDTTERTKKHILKTIAEIQGHIAAKKEFEPMPSALCNWCGYRPLCPAWKHLYKGQGPGTMDKEEIKSVITEYFDIKKTEQKNEKRLVELQKQIREYMVGEGVTRVFGDEGMIAQKKIQRYAYDFDKIKEILSPIGKWEAILSADEKELKKILKELPAPVRDKIAETRSVAKEYTILSTSQKSKEIN